MAVHVFSVMAYDCALGLFTSLRPDACFYEVPRSLQSFHVSEKPISLEIQPLRSFLITIKYFLQPFYEPFGTFHLGRNDRSRF
jgi:hypothetical protein